MIRDANGRQAITTSRRRATRTIDVTKWSSCDHNGTPIARQNHDVTT
jgi:hypothetical protein